MTIEVAELSSVISDSRLWSDICEIVAPNYLDPEVILQQEVLNNDRIYLALTTDGVEGFFMNSWRSLNARADIVGSVYLGLSGVATSRRGCGLGSALYRRFLQDAEDWSKHRSGMPLRWWFYTASPLAAAAWWRLAPSMEPLKDGTVSDPACCRLDELEGEFGWGGHRDQHWPFVLRNIAQARYSLTEAATVGENINKAPGSLFDLTHLDETAGDRLVFLGETSCNDIHALAPSS